MDDDFWTGWPDRWAGMDCDVRTASGAIPREVKDGFGYDEVPWQRFRHFYGPGEEIPGLLATPASGDTDAADTALKRLWNSLHHQVSPSTVWRRLLQPVTTRRRSQDAERDHLDGEG
ncbi:hypothetical protein OG407_00165 [Streptomyces sp. NBC_01515]|uniref:hypothetical protein n=1 Tax=Streptomyces sp. NBC_01515 TaxID=2903890 RepID=UPI0038702C9E